MSKIRTTICIDFEDTDENREAVHKAVQTWVETLDEQIPKVTSHPKFNIDWCLDSVEDDC